jgi:uncharacterized paraquat-inducible protein A
MIVIKWVKKDKQLDLFGKLLKIAYKLDLKTLSDARDCINRIIDDVKAKTHLRYCLQCKNQFIGTDERGCPKCHSVRNIPIPPPKNN